MSRVALAGIQSLTFYKDAETRGKRSSPIQQLTCVGKPCKLYTPDVVRCHNVGGEGAEIDWKCEADLPETLRFGRVEVSCEGWSKPGDPYILKGSCGLEYHLVQVPSVLRSPDSHISPSSWDLPHVIFTVLWSAFLLLIVYGVISSCRGGDTSARTTNNSRPRPRDPPSGGRFPGSHPYDPPPPYSYSKPQSDNDGTGWRPGFWSGAALGGLGATLLNRGTAQPTAWDWERDMLRQTPPAGSAGSFFGGGRRTQSQDDRQEGSSRGPSNLGSMRRSAGLGGTNVR